ncbi:hypothetical protein M2459_000127 [Parabacteroides sp. PF5-5]|uniref:type IX secretion system plug protein n=1 Tax=unclassified Parabacteroides TaxID=2649774 RepID=UPI0024748A64|nr:MULTISPECIES: DUF5103 domain-containing protein [unclassified Parabacteroides]MDH6303795.1 hypothetical protein [Parabacteroides sp. PH5-39]MDH6314412.1 hypothetical protein [Parabacteroides sp. PF5-13]MDH6318523.1 hypothetical protein [Parabacteroides sp. PH5-13]MDH6322184.1 hypothetical protein [Parabacteroides sp. PH5-8]MDH6325736.1 hypothetical protein [Parabacteroides sp. PH5-41]
MKRYYLIFFLSLGLVVAGAAQEKYQTRVFTNQIKTLQVKQAGELISTPIIELDSDQQIEISFDALEHNYNRFGWAIVHCDADWTPSSLSPLEYLTGFQGLTVDDFATSMSTSTQYTNYILTLPNDDVQFKVSGNYAVRFYREDDPSRTLFTACFSVVEPLVTVSATVSGKTLIDSNREHQQLDFTIQHGNVDITYPQTDLKIFVYQNRRFDNAVTNLKPTGILSKQLVYNNNRALIFEGGKEYRRMEFLSNKYNGMGVNSIEYFNPYYNVELLVDRPRSGQSYFYDQDQNGRYFIRCSSCNDPYTEADYYIVHFTLAAEPFLDGDVYLNGDLTYNILNEDSKMEYNYERNCYEKALLLKQGSYNFQYLYLEHGTNMGQSIDIEGNSYQTENEYAIYVYFRPIGTRYDRLIGICQL